MKKIAILFGGLSTEHEVSICSASSVIENINKSKYDVLPIYMDKEGNYFKYIKNINEIKKIPVGEYPLELEAIDNVFGTLKKVDVIFPILHGLYGEDGTIQGMFELLNKKYVGCKVLSSAICMDKVYAKVIFDKAKIKQAAYLYLKVIDDKIYQIDETFNIKEISYDEIDNLISNKLKYPVFIKPSNSGSSIGINKANNKEEMIEYVKYASIYDKKILIEETINGKEIECAVLGKDNDVIASTVGRIIPADEFYSFDAKYKNDKSLALIPTDLDESVVKEVKKLAIKAFNAVDGSGLSRVDFFATENNEIYINEINTMPGFTDISMYPKLFMYDGLSYSDLIDKLIELS